MEIPETSGIRSLPINPQEFDHDQRISYSKLDNKHIAVLPDGSEFEFDRELQRWIPLADEDDEVRIQEYQKLYGTQEPEEQQSGPAHGKKRKNNRDHTNAREDGNGQSKSKKKQARNAPPPKKNSAVYVTGLPLDVTVEEVAELFSKKCGVIAEEIDSGRPRIKLYTDAQGNFKGDALIVFFKPQSVDMAIMLLDDTDFRFSPSGLSSGKMRVMAADSSYKKTNYEHGQTPQGSKDGGEASGSSHHQDKVKIIKKTQKLSAKLADWDDDEPLSLFPTPKGGKWDKVVILRHMFTLEELDEDPAALLDIKEDIREECAKLGTVTNVVLFDQEEEGIVSVKFQTREAAEACVQLMHGRAFAGRTVEAFFATGKEKFRRSRKDDDGEQEED